MINIGGVSLRAFAVAVRWAKMKGFPNEISDWTKEQSDCLQKVCEIYDERRK